MTSKIHAKLFQKTSKKELTRERRCGMIFRLLQREATSTEKKFKKLSKKY